MPPSRSESDSVALNRRRFLQGAGALILHFALATTRATETGAEASNLGSLKVAPLLDSWIRIDASGAVTVFTGKAELGQGLKTALIQVAAEELEVAPGVIRLITADTGLTPNEGYTAGSHSMPDSATAIRNAAAQVRELLKAKAASRWRVAPQSVSARDGSVVGPKRRRLTYGMLVSDGLLQVTAKPVSALKDPSEFRVMGRSWPRVDIPAKVTGGAAYVQDLRLPNMVHARVVRPPSPGARLLSLELEPVTSMPGVLEVVRNGSFVAVIADEEYVAVQAARALSKLATWKETATLPVNRPLTMLLRELATKDGVVLDESGASGNPPSGKTLRATFTKPWHMHGSIGPSCAVAHSTPDGLTVWTHTQSAFHNRASIAALLDMPLEKVRCIHMEGSGCYGHNGADDAAAEAALLAVSLPNLPVRLQWMREEEHLWEPYGPAMVTSVSANVTDAGEVTNYSFELWSNTHATRPVGKPNAYISANHLEHPRLPDPPDIIMNVEGSGDRNAVPLYNFRDKKIVWHFVRDMPLRVSSLRTLGAYMNVFSLESFVDDLATTTGIDPVEFRLRHLDDARACAVIRAVAEKFNWHGNVPARHRGQGFGFARYKNLASFCAVAMEVEIDPESGHTQVLRVVAAVDCGEVVSPDGVRNQIEGGILQSISWSLFESVSFDERRVTCASWASYPIMRFSSVPAVVEVQVLPQPGTPFLGAGEAAQGPAAGALANAIADAARRKAGVRDTRRLRDIPFSPDKVRALMSASS